jgi:hypothetical protein
MLMSIEAISAVLHHSKSSATTKLVLLGIANHQGDAGAWPAISTLAKYANCTPRRVQQCIRELILLGELQVVTAGGLGGTNLYWVLVACPEECDRTFNHSDRGVKKQVLGGEKTGTRGVKPSSPKPIVNQVNQRFAKKIEKDEAQIRSLEERRRGRELMEEMRLAREQSTPIPECIHDKSLLRCRICQHKLAETMTGPIEKEN